MLPMDCIFTKPFVFEIMGGGFEKPKNCSFYIPRHPRVCKIHWDRSYLETMSFTELQVAAAEALNVEGGDYEDMQTESQWIEKLLEKDLSAKELKKKYEAVAVAVAAADKGRKSEASLNPTAQAGEPTIDLRDLSQLPNTPRRQYPQSSATSSFSSSEAGSTTDSLKRTNTPVGYLEANRHEFPPAKRPCLASILDPQSSRERQGERLSLQVSIAGIIQIRNGHSSISPLRGATVFLPHYLMKFPKLLERITNHNAGIIHVLPILKNAENIRSLMPTKKAVVLIESNKATLTKKTLKSLYEILKPINEGVEAGQGYGWETYDWRIVNYHQPEGKWETDWSLWHVWSVI